MSSHSRAHRRWISFSQSAMTRRARCVRSGPGQPVTAHWGVEDPADVEGDDESKRKAFLKAFTTLRRRIELFLSLPHGKLDKLALSQRLNTIGKS